MTSLAEVILETKRMRIRRLAMDDLNDLFALYRDPEIRRYFVEGVLTFEETRSGLERQVRGYPQYPTLGMWAMIYQETGRFIGRCGLLPCEIDDKPETEISYLLDKSFWHQGLATEAAQGILDYGFQNLDLTRILALIAPDNTASQRVAERIGMILERKVDGIAGDHYPTLIYTTTRK